MTMLTPEGLVHEHSDTCSHSLFFDEVPMAQFPHCDSRVLHHPFDKCKFCNMHPEMQLSRFDNRIAFTGRWRQGLELCPAEKARGLGSINRWYGNVAFTPEVEAADEAYWAEFREKLDKGLAGKLVGV